jgi:putative membrane protein
MLENALTAAWVTLLVATARRFPLSNLSYALIALHLALHTIGAHYTYEFVPYDDWSRALTGRSLNAALGWQRNHFDRLVHFGFGLLLVYPARELFLRIAGARGIWGYYLPIDVVMSFSMLYELVEWAVAEVFGGELGQAYLGTQGDQWDAHKDMALATCGAVLSMLVVALVNWRYNRRFGAEIRESLAVKGRAPLGEVRLKDLIDGKPTV